MSAPTKLDRLLFRHIGFHLKPIHARIVRAIHSLEAQKATPGYLNIIKELNSGLLYPALHKYCIFLRTYKLVKITTSHGICQNKRRAAFAHITLTNHARDLITRADAPAPAKP